VYVDTKICLTATLSLALRAFCVNRCAAFLAQTLRAFLTRPLNSCVKQLLVLCVFLATFATAETPTSEPDSEVYIAPPDINLTTARLLPQYTLREEIYGVQTLHDELVGRKPYEGMFDDVEFKEPATGADITVFWLLQALDVYTTLEATGYRCVVEVNPLLPTKPTFEEIVLLKMVPHLFWDIEDMQAVDLATVNAITGLIVANNVDVASSAKKMCP